MALQFRRRVSPRPSRGKLSDISGGPLEFHKFSPRLLEILRSIDSSEKGEIQTCVCRADNRDRFARSRAKCLRRSVFYFRLGRLKEGKAGLVSAPGVR